MILTLSSNSNTSAQSHSNPPIQTNKRESKHTLSHEIGKNWATKPLKYINGEPKNKGEVHLPVGSESKCKRGSKKPCNGSLGGCLSCYFREQWSSWVRGGVLGEENSPQPPFYLIRAGGARPGELTPSLFIFSSLHVLDCVRHAALL